MIQVCSDSLIIRCLPSNRMVGYPWGCIAQRASIQKRVQSTFLGGTLCISPCTKAGSGSVWAWRAALYSPCSHNVAVIIEVALVKRCGSQAKFGLELSVAVVTAMYVLLTSLRRLRCLNAKTWEDRPVVLRQIEQIGEKSCVFLTF